MNAPTPPRQGLCTLRDCPDHRADPGWRSVWQPRPAPTAHLRAVK